MKIILAGYNVDTEVLSELAKNSPDRQDITPEVISASYARISRDPRPVNELRAAARQEVELARRSNQNIIFKMGHHSVAEHAVFNFDILGISRLAIEELEHFRLCAYTEKSQRYITLDNDFVIPEEIRQSQIANRFSQIIKEQNALYHKLNEKLQPYVFKKYSALAKDPKNRNLLEGWAKEDARYITSLATETQLGATINARNLELLVRRFTSHELKEVQELGKALYAAAAKIAPSIILFTAANDFDQKTYEEIKKLRNKEISKKKPKDVSLESYTQNSDEILVASLLHTTGQLSFKECLAKAKKMKKKDQEALVKTACRHMEFFDAPLREFEYADATFDIVLSASCFAQMKRHRMATITSQKYDPDLGITLPESIEEVGMGKAFKAIIRKTDDLYYNVRKSFGETVAQYVLTNAHRKRILMKVNARELYHISRLREDNHAQWDIRHVSHNMVAEARKIMPLTLMLCCGKDSYVERYTEVYGRPPRVTVIPG